MPDRTDTEPSRPLSEYISNAIWHVNYDAPVPNFTDKGMLESWLNMAQALEASRKEDRERIAKLEGENRWIPIEERLPEGTGEDYVHILCTPIGRRTIGAPQDIANILFVRERTNHNLFSHWKALSPPPAALTPHPN